MASTSTKEAAAQTRKILRTKYGKENVHVRIGRGTGSGWVHARVKVPAKPSCTCKIDPDRTCEPCRALWRETLEALDFLVATKVEFNKWWTDEGTQAQSFIGTVEIIR